MLSTLEKVKHLEDYLAMGNFNIDPVIELTINKLLSREYQRVAEIKNRLNQDTEQFEKQYAMNSNHFRQRYESGKLGDDMDFIEWSATLDMLGQIEKQLKWLEIGIDK